MPDRSRTTPGKKRDLNQRAFDIVNRIARESEGETVDPAEAEKDPAAVALGRKGGRKGGPARAAKMTAQQRRDAAQKAAEARWRRREDPATPSSES